MRDGFSTILLRVSDNKFQHFARGIKHFKVHFYEFPLAWLCINFTEKDKSTIHYIYINKIEMVT